MKIDTSWIYDFNIYKSSSYVVMDFETTTLDKGSALNSENDTLLACWIVVRDGRITKNHSAGGATEHWALLEDIKRADFIVAHNAKFELSWLARSGLLISDKPVFCTMLAEKVLAGNRPWLLSLNACAERYGLGGKESLVDSYIKKGVDTTSIPLSWLTKYCHMDVALTHELFKVQIELLIKAGQLGVAHTRFLTTIALADIETKGLSLDKKAVIAEYEAQEMELELLTQDLESITGGANLKSRTQMAKIIYSELGFKELVDRKGRPVRGAVTKQFPDGHPKTNKETLLALKATNNKQRKFLETYQQFNAVSAALSKTLKPFKECVEGDGVLHFAFNQHVAATHRLSSTGKKYKVQGQNIPRKYKRFLQTRDQENFYIGDVDFAKLEFNVAAFLTQDPIAMEDVISDFDVHKYTAMVLNGIDIEEVTKAQRTAAKSDTFGPLFGKVSGTPAQVEYYKAFREKYSDMTRVQTGWVDAALSSKDHSIVAPNGLRFYFPNVKMTSSGYVQDNTLIRNYFIQSFATADIVLIGLYHLWYHMQGMKSYIVSTVHDSIVMEIHKDEVEVIKELCNKCLLEAVYIYLEKVYGIVYNLPLSVELGMGKNLEEIEIEVSMKYTNSLLW